MTREATNAEKAVFGADVKIDPDTDLPIEQGIGSASDRERTAQRAAQAAHSAEFERLQEAEKSLAAELAEAKTRIASLEKTNTPSNSTATEH